MQVQFKLMHFRLKLKLNSLIMRISLAKGEKAKAGLNMKLPRDDENNLFVQKNEMWWYTLEWVEEKNKAVIVN